MSEKFGKCFYCDGKGEVIVEKSKVECLSCDGSGHSGDAIAYCQRQADDDWERERPSFYYGKSLGE